MRFFRPATCSAFVAAVVIGSVSLLADVRTASAQGGMVCDYGSRAYKACCRASYGQFPKMGYRARANDIDACMKERRTRRN